MIERTSPGGLTLLEHRSLNGPVTPNENDPATHPPGTVGAGDTIVPGDPDGLVFESGPAGPSWPRSVLRPSPWAGWPADWATPNWHGQLETLTDTAWTCLDLNSSLLATMPPYLVGAADSLPVDWLNNPDPDLYTSWEEFAKQLFWDYQAAGEVFVLTTARYANGFPARFHVVPPWTVDAEMAGVGRRYRIGSMDVTPDLLHVRYQGTTTDAHGHGPLEAGRARIVAASVLTRYAANMASAGGIPNAVLKTADDLTAAQAAELQAQWVTSRMSNLGIPAVLSGGLEFETLQYSPRDMALVELAQLNESRIAVLLGVPPFLVGLPSGGDSMTYSNVISLFDYHWRAGLRPKASTVMGALSQWLTPRGTSIELNRDAYVQPGPYERAQTWAILVGIGVLTAEQVAAIERFTATGALPESVL